MIWNGRWAIRFLRWILAAAAAALAAGMPASPAFGATQPEMILLCTNLVSGTSWQIKINFQASTVDSSPARIRRTTISWRGTDGGNYTLDRQSGKLTVIFPSSTGGYFLHDRCTRSVR